MAGSATVKEGREEADEDGGDDDNPVDEGNIHGLDSCVGGGVLASAFLEIRDLVGRMAIFGWMEGDRFQNGADGENWRVVGCGGERGGR